MASLICLLRLFGFLLSAVRIVVVILTRLGPDDVRGRVPTAGWAVVVL
jgi:hypothetical protein